MKFDKYMVERSVESSIYFPPFGMNDLAFDWSGKELEISILKPLEADRTYILTIGARAQDTRGNYLGKAYNLVFSTGERVDTGMVSGTVYAQKAESYTVAAFPVTPDIDTLRPAMTLPRYVTQSDDSGRYVLKGLSDGKYRLICFDDQMRNYTYAPQYDLYASATRDVSISEFVNRVEGVNFIPAMEDTSHPQLYSAELTNTGLLLLKFSEPLDTSHIRPSYFVVSDSVTGMRLPVDFAARLESNRYNVVLETDTPLKSRTKYFVTAGDSISDSYGNRMAQSNNTVTFVPDRNLVPFIPYFFNFPDSLRGVSSYDTLYCQFAAPSIEGHIASPSCVLLDSSGDPIANRVAPESGTIYRVYLHGLISREWYTLCLNYKTYVNGAEKDSLVKRSFAMVDSNSLGDITGTVTGIQRGAEVVVAAEGENGKTYHALADSTGGFEIAGIPAGDYSLKAYVRRGKSVRYFNGRSFPYQFAEPFGVYDGKLKIRARWTVEGVAVRLH